MAPVAWRLHMSGCMRQTCVLTYWDAPFSPVSVHRHQRSRSQRRLRPWLRPTLPRQAFFWQRACVRAAILGGSTQAGVQPGRQATMQPHSPCAVDAVPSSSSWSASLSAASEAAPFSLVPTILSSQGPSFLASMELRGTALFCFSTYRVRGRSGARAR